MVAKKGGDDHLLSVSLPDMQDQEQILSNLHHSMHTAKDIGAHAAKPPIHYLSIYSLVVAGAMVLRE